MDTVARNTNTKSSSKKNKSQLVTLATCPVTQLKGIGERTAEKLKRLGIITVQDVLFHLPLRYEDRTRITPIGSLQPYEPAVVDGSVELTDIKFGRRRMLLCRISDGTGFLTLRFFHFSAAQKEGLARGRRIRCYGEVRNGPQSLEIVHPEYSFIDEDNIIPTEETLTSIYPATDGVHQLTLRTLTDNALAIMQEIPIQELLPASLCERLNFPDLKDAINWIHRPPSDVSITMLMDETNPARQRLVFEELLAHQISMKQLRSRAQKHRAPVIEGKHSLETKLVTALPFDLTNSQKKVISEIKNDLTKACPMQRLVQGDVGCGKTLVAVMAALSVVEAGMQTAIMAPTEILSEQHYKNFCQWLQPLGIHTTWLTGKQKVAERRQAQEEIAIGKARIVVGTHALFQEEVGFDNLGLIVIDEQHRFGVHQRMALREKGKSGQQYPHQLIMTATPIPRTLAMTAYADLDVSIIDELPPGRKEVETIVVSNDRRDEITARVHHACKAGRQVYWVCSLIEESEALQCQAASDTAALLQECLPELKIGLIHGRMKPNDKELVMSAFKQGEIDLLVATTVIEVGVDVPNASLMVIENSERFGLSQLHQLRGRVGRGSEKSSCVLMYQAPLSENSRKRLAVMRETSDGFKIAQQDLEIRGPGEVLGTRQTGMMQFHIADIIRDQALIPEVNKAAEDLLVQYPENAQLIVRRWLGETEKYGNVG